MNVDQIPHDAILESRNRTWTPLLLTCLRATAVSEERDKIADTLIWLDDPRAVDPLRRILEDTTLPDAVREKAGCVYRLMANSPEGAAEISVWWNACDEVLRRHALLMMECDRADIVVPIAWDRSHPLHHAAIATMEYGFEDSEFLAPKLHALTHPNTETRNLAVHMQIWDESVASLEPLLRLAEGETDEKTHAAACMVLTYHSARRAMVRLKELARELPEPRRSAARRSFDAVQESLQEALVQSARHPHMLRWLAPVLSDFSTLPFLPPADESTYVSPPPPKPPARFTADELIALLTPSDGEWRDKLYFPAVDWQAIAVTDRRRLGKFLSTHADCHVRATACSAFGSWRNLDELLRLAYDRTHLVQNAAAEELAKFQGETELAEFAWSRLFDRSPRCRWRYLTVFARNAPRDVAIGRLTQVALETPSDKHRRIAILELSELGIAKDVRQLAPLLHDPPRSSWGVHAELLRAFALHQVSPPPAAVRALSEADHADVQLALMPFV